LRQGIIWIVDDDPQALKYYQELIGASLAEFHVRSVQGGVEALALLVDETPDLVILDLMMPEVDGFQVLEHLRTNPKTAWIPVIILTGKMLSYEDVKRLDSPKLILQSKGLLTDREGVALMQQALMDTAPLPQPTSILIKQALAHLHQNYTRALSLHELAETVGVSKSYLSRIFKLEMGISLWDYLNRFRVQKAQERLIQTSDSVTAIAAAVGFEDVGYFGRIFRGITGYSPRIYRQKAGSTHMPGPFRQ
jgi:YesN/AraC family two-component response regulator